MIGFTGPSIFSKITKCENRNNLEGRYTMIFWKINYLIYHLCSSLYFLFSHQNNNLKNDKLYLNKIEGSPYIFF